MLRRMGLVALSFVSLQTHAQSTLSIKADKAKKNRWSITTTLLSAKNLSEVGSRDDDSISRLSLSPGVKLSEKLKASVTLSGQQQLSAARKSTFMNTKINLSHLGSELTEDLTALGTTSLILPTNVESRHKTSFNGAIVVSPALQIAANVSKQPVIVTLGVLAGKNIHTYTRDASGEANIDYYVTPGLAVETSIRRVTFEIAGDLTRALTYEGSDRSSFSISETISFSIDKSTFISIGHSNGADTLAADGRSGNVRIFDENSSQVFTMLSITN